MTDWMKKRDDLVKQQVLECLHSAHLTDYVRSRLINICLAMGTTVDDIRKADEAGRKNHEALGAR